MGNYVFDADALVDAVTSDADRDDSRHDMGGDIVPAFADRGEAGVYDFGDNDVPGSFDRDRDYWRDVGTLSSYYDAHMDLISPLPVFNLYNDRWPMYTYYGPSPPAKFVDGADGEPGAATNSIVSPGVVVSGGVVTESVLSPRCFVDTEASVERSVLLDGVRVGAGAVVRGAILDKNVAVPPGVRIGVDPEADAARGLTMTADGLVVAGKGQPIQS